MVQTTRKGWPLACLWIVAASGCVSTTTQVRPAGPYVVQELERFRVLEGDRLVGRVLLLQIAVPDAPVSFYRIEHDGGSWAGIADLGLRFFRYEPFHDQPQELGVFPMNEGVALLLECDGPVRILPPEGRGAATEAAAQELNRKALEEARR